MKSLIRNLFFCLLFSMTVVSCIPRGASPQQMLLSSPFEWQATGNPQVLVTSLWLPVYLNQNSMLVLQENGVLKAIEDTRWAQPLGETLREALICEMRSRTNEIKLNSTKPYAISVNLDTCIMDETGVLHVRGSFALSHKKERCAINLDIAPKAMKKVPVKGQWVYSAHRQAVKQIADLAVAFINGQPQEQ